MEERSWLLLRNWKTRVPYHEKEMDWDFPGGAVVKTSPSKAGGAGSIPDQGTKIPPALRPNNQTIKQSKIVTNWIKTLKMVHIKKKSNNRWTSTRSKADYQTRGCLRITWSILKQMFQIPPWDSVLRGLAGPGVCIFHKYPQRLGDSQATAGEALVQPSRLPPWLHNGIVLGDLQDAGMYALPSDDLM